MCKTEYRRTGRGLCGREDGPVPGSRASLRDRGRLCGARPAGAATTTTTAKDDAIGGWCKKSIGGFVGGPVPSAKISTLGKNARLRVDAQKRLESPGGARGKTRGRFTGPRRGPRREVGAARETSRRGLPRPAQVLEAVAAVLPEDGLRGRPLSVRDGLAAAAAAEGLTIH